ncbi:DUF1109 family protein [Sphingobium sp. AR-3-1]|uniref:DUF1109 family protein n=1 Tax=Sphingobium psychrophilum TaxID=2728834 RepID=A0A7X9ZTL8_9SPHN|nr:DUF1109 family protein [Sphingobium psychrophilum]
MTGFWPIVLLFALVAAVSMAEMAHASPGDWFAMRLGDTRKKCRWLVLMLSAAPIFGLIAASQRRLGRPVW